MPAYAHNDYANRQPLAGALARGMRGVEADVFLVNGALRVAHDRRAARSAPRLDSLYLAPIATMLARCGTFTESRPFLLTLEIKEADPAAFDSIVAELQRAPASLRTARVRIVLVGWHPPLASPVWHAADGAGIRIGVHQRIASPDFAVGAALDPRVALLSVDYGKTIGRPWRSASARRRWWAALRRIAAEASEVPLRAHNVPVDPAIYRRLREAGVTLIGTKAPAATAVVLESGS